MDMITHDGALNMRISIELREQLRVAAFHRRKSMAQIVREALERDLAEDTDGADDVNRAG